MSRGCPCAGDCPVSQMEDEIYDLKERIERARKEIVDIMRDCSSTTWNDLSDILGFLGEASTTDKEKRVQ
jgi:DNA-binding ferritin-like protein (Dps family)